MGKLKSGKRSHNTKATFGLRVFVTPGKLEFGFSKLVG